MEKEPIDVAIIGGGPAGLNASLVLGRARKKVAVIDAGRPRNAVTREVHGFLTRDGISPSEFRRIAMEEISATEREELRRNQVPLLDSPIRRIDSSEGIVRQVVLEDGTIVPCTGIFFKPNLVIGSDLPQTIGCEITEWGGVVVDEFGKTNIPGVYSAGDAASQMHQTIAAASRGALVAAVITGNLNAEAWGKKA
ncbi:NAD(P)/FAD-dependent oxidoreductase [Paenibacillus arenilitoris]|uniref:FAD-dependent oxidoreductase n=1 Tax=Paenibacillus arenilitoris TaxID=2772299 RepID=A0A927CUA5_9BACL|nr:FAD-dependent oxidoreductase [Paenibacillus arenilitoris]MBD2871690.1 FAD-dependent oxidoreductase [Paenibacillus arenilitoris]